MTTTPRSTANDFGIPADGNRPANLPRTRQYNDSPDLSSITSDSVLLDAQTKVAPNWTLKGRVVSMRAKTREVDVWPYRENLTGLDSCDNSAASRPFAATTSTCGPRAGRVSTR